MPVIRETHLHQGRQTLKLGLVRVVHDLFPEERLKTSYSILEGIFCHLVDSDLSTREVSRIDEELLSWVARDEPIPLIGREDGYYVYDVDGLVVRTLYPALTLPSEVEPFTLAPFWTPTAGRTSTSPRPSTCRCCASTCVGSSTASRSKCRTSTSSPACGPTRRPPSRSARARSW